jgi:hypothetical protein
MSIRMMWLVLALFGCSSGTPPAFEVSFEADAKPGEEIWKCRVMQLPIVDTTDVHHVVHQQSQLHHMDITVLASVNIPEGDYDCAPLYQQYPSLMEQPTLYAAQTQNGDITLPPGVVARIPAGITVLYEIHDVNASPNPAHVFSHVKAWTIPPDQVTGTISAGVTRDRELNIPPRSDHTEWTRCLVDQDIDVLFISSHTHKLGHDVTVFRFDGQNTGDQVFQNTDWQAPKLLEYTPTMHVAAGTGFEFRCHYINDSDTEVHWGFTAQDEMCNFVLVWTPGTTATSCKAVQTSDGLGLM